MTHRRTTKQIAAQATSVQIDLILPCGCAARLDLVQTGLGSHVAVITAKELHHKCPVCSTLPAWELHIWRHMTPAKFTKYGFAQIDLLDTKEDKCH